MRLLNRGRNRRLSASSRRVFAAPGAAVVLADLGDFCRAHSAPFVADDAMATGVLGRPDGFGLTPGYIDYGGVSKDGRALVQPFQSGARVDIGLDMMEQRRRSINDAFLVTLFQILAERSRMTATTTMIESQVEGALFAPIVGYPKSSSFPIPRAQSISNKRGGQ